MTDALDVAVPLWAWFALGGAIVVMLAIDLALHRDDHVVSFREAAIWSGIWIGMGLAFGLVLWGWQGGDVAATYYSAYLIEKALSVDNVFIFALLRHWELTEHKAPTCSHAAPAHPARFAGFRSTQPRSRVTSEDAIPEEGGAVLL